jgi:hypothetical protein
MMHSKARTSAALDANNPPPLNKQTCSNENCSEIGGLALPQEQEHPGGTCQLSIYKQHHALHE